MRKNELITQDISTLIKQIAIPSSIGIFFNTMFNVIDTFYVGSISTVAISALSYSFMVYFLLLSSSFGFSSALTAHIGNSLGSKKLLLAKFFTLKGIGLVSYFSILLTFFGMFFLKDIFLIIGAKGEVLDLALEYTYVILWGAIPTLIALGANGILVALGDTKSYRNSLIVGFFLNLILDPLFIYGYGVIPAFGFVGVAYATLLVQLVTFFYILYKLSQSELFTYQIVKILYPNKRIYRKIFKQAVPVSINMFMISLGGMILIYFVSEYGYKAVAAFGIGFRVEQIILLPILGLNAAVTTIVANNFGAKKLDRIYEVRKKALHIGYKMSFLGIFLLILFGKYIIMSFDNDQVVVDIAYEYIVAKSFILAAYVILFISNSTLQGIKQPMIIPFVSGFRQIIMPVFILVILVHSYKVDLLYVWIILGLINYFSALFLYYYVEKKLKINICLNT
jgi:putative MATE family efflux protein